MLIYAFHGYGLFILEKICDFLFMNLINRMAHHLLLGRKLLPDLERLRQQIELNDVLKQLKSCL